MLLIAVIAAVGVLPGMAVAAPAGGQQLNAADMTLLNGVRLAGLWEMPAGQMAAEKGQSAKVREIGAGSPSSTEARPARRSTRPTSWARRIPSEPTAEQKGWLTEMQKASGARFDQIFVTRLRVAHGKIFPVIGAVRASTRDPTVRKLCDDANVFVEHHMQMLESTGLVRWPELPPAAMPAPGEDGLLAAASANSGPQVGVSSTVVWLVFLAALGTGGIATYRMLRRS